MIYIGKYKEFSSSSDYPSLREYFSDYPYDGQGKVIHYLKHGHKDLVSMQIPKDVFTGEYIGYEKIGMSDGVYTWWNTLAYYVEKYNLRLPKEFENHILSTK